METKRAEFEAAYDALDDARFELNVAHDVSLHPGTPGYDVADAAIHEARQALATADKAIERALAALPPEHDHD